MAVTYSVGNILATEDLSKAKNKFIGFDGKICKLDERPFGVLLKGVKSGKLATCAVHGVTLVAPSGEEIPIGAPVQVGASGKLQNIEDGLQVGFALDSVKSMSSKNIHILLYTPPCAKIEGSNQLDGVGFEDITFTHCSFNSVHLSGGGFYDSDLSFSDFSFADLSNTINALSNFSYCDFTSANLSGADFSNANLTGALMPANANTKAKFKTLVGEGHYANTIWIDGTLVSVDLQN